MGRRARRRHPARAGARAPARRRRAGRRARARPRRRRRGRRRATSWRRRRPRWRPASASRWSSSPTASRAGARPRRRAQLDAAWIAVVEHLRGGRAARPAARRRRALVGRAGGVPHRGRRPGPSACCASPSRSTRRAAPRRRGCPSSTPWPSRRSWSRAPRTRSGCRPPGRDARVVTVPGNHSLTGDLEALRGGRRRAGWPRCWACQTDPMATRMRDAMCRAARRAALRADREAHPRAARRRRGGRQHPRRCSSGSRGGWCRPSRCRSRTCAASSCPRRPARGHAAAARPAPGDRLRRALDRRARAFAARRRRDARGRRLRARRPRPGRPRDPRLHGFDAWSRRTSRSSATRATPITASTCAAARATSASSSTARCWPRARAPCCSSRRPAHPLLPAARGRRAPSAAQRQADDLRLQGPRVLLVVRRRRDLAWTYEDPLPEAAPVRGLVAFFDELVDVTLDGERRARPRTALRRRSPTSRADRRIGSPGGAGRRAVGLRAGGGRRTGSCSRARRSTGCASRATSASSAWPRRAATRRIVAPVIAGARAARGDLRAAEGRRLGPPRRRARTCCCPSSSCTRRRARWSRSTRPRTSPRSAWRALELYRADAPVGFDLDEHAALCREWSRADRRPRPRPGRQGLRLRRAPARARLPRRAARPRRRRPWATRR